MVHQVSVPRVAVRGIIMPVLLVEEPEVLVHRVSARRVLTAAAVAIYRLLAAALREVAVRLAKMAPAITARTARTRRLPGEVVMPAVAEEQARLVA